MIDRQSLIRDDLKTMSFMGVVVDTDDPLKLGRCRVNVFGKFDELSTAEIPWAWQQYSQYYGTGGGSASISIPRMGQIVNVRFDNGNLYSPVVIGIQEPASDLLAEIASSYTNAHALVYDGDEKLKMFYTQQKGLTIALKNSSIVIANDYSINIQSNSGSSVITMDGHGNVTVTTNSDVTMHAQGNIQVVADQNIDIIAGNNTVSLDDSGVNIDGSNIFINGKNQVLYAKIPQATDITDVSEIGVSNSVKVGS